MSDHTRLAEEAARRLLKDCEAFISEWARRRVRAGRKIERPADSYFGWKACRNPELIEMLRRGGFPKPQTIDAVNEFIREWRDAWKDGRDPEEEEKERRRAARAAKKARNKR